MIENRLQRVLDAARAVVDSAKPHPDVESGLVVPSQQGMELEVAMAYMQSPGEDPLVFLPAAGLDLKAVMRDLECKLIEQALVRSNESKAGASRLLHINRSTLVEKIRRLKLRKLNAPSKKVVLDRPGDHGLKRGKLRNPGSGSSGHDDEVGSIG